MDSQLKSISTDIYLCKYYIKKIRKNLKLLKYQEHEHAHRCLKLSLSDSQAFSAPIKHTQMMVKQLEKSHKCLNLVQKSLDQQSSNSFPRSL